MCFLTLLSIGVLYLTFLIQVDAQELSPLKEDQVNKLTEKLIARVIVISSRKAI